DFCFFRGRTSPTSKGPMPRWVLVLDSPSGDPTRRVGGLPLALRLVLDAQSGGASGVVLVPEAETARPALADERRRIPVLDSVPPDSAEVRVPASYLVHRQLFKKLFEQGAMPRDLAREPFEIDVPWGFSSFDVSDAETARAAERALFRSLR